MKKLIVILSLFLLSCASTIIYSKEQSDYLVKIRQFPLEFEMPKEQVEEAWGRAQSFIGRYSSMKLQIVTDYVIQTYNPVGIGAEFGYYVTKTPMGVMVQFTVQCNVNNSLLNDHAMDNAHILASYIKTGELPYPYLIFK